MILFGTFLLNLLTEIYGYTAQHTVWVPAGKLVQVPCKLRSLEKSDTLEGWAYRNENLDIEFTSNSAVGWYDRLGRLIHVGEILLVHVPPFEASELSVTQYVPRETAPNEEPMSLAPEYRKWIGGTNQLLQVKHLDAVTCSELQATTSVGVQDPWVQFERPTHIRKQIFFLFRIYVQPTIIWNYAAPPEVEFENRSVLLQPIEQWCHKQRSIKNHASHVCSAIYEQRMPFVKLSKLTDDIPMIQSSALSYNEIGIVVDLTSSPLNILADPTSGELAYIHATLKNSLDRFIIEDLEYQMNIEDIEELMTVATRIQAICPPGSHTYVPVPALQNLRLDGFDQITLTNGSASALLPFKLLCHPCADGKSPRSAYAYDRCHECPRGYYLGNTGWPSSAGCLPCPRGFTTDKVGATSADACKLNAGAVTRWALSFLLDRWFALEYIIAGEASPDTKTRALGQHQQTAWAWIGRTDVSVWIWGSVYTLIVFWLIALAVYRLHLYFRLQSVLKRQHRLLLKAALIGQINLVSHIKQRAKRAGTPGGLEVPGQAMGVKT